MAGDWNGDGIDSIGIFRFGTWLLDVDGNGRWSEPDRVAKFGRTGDVPLVGDFNGDGIDDLAIVRNGKIYLDTNNNRELDANDVAIAYEPEQGEPVVGKWSGGSADEIAWFKPIERNVITVANRPETK